MPMRLLFYMTEVWRDVLKNTEKSEIKRKFFKNGINYNIRL